jgi:cell division ATPase FtsA
MPVLWLIDEETKTKDPLGMDARKLELIADVFLLPKVYYNNLMDVFKKLDIDVRDMVPTIL